MPPPVRSVPTANQTAAMVVSGAPKKRGTANPRINCTAGPTRFVRAAWFKIAIHLRMVALYMHIMVLAAACRLLMRERPIIGDRIAE